MLTHTIVEFFTYGDEGVNKTRFNRRCRMKWKSFAGMMLILTVFGACTTAATSKSVPRMTKEELKPMLGKPDVLIVDVRADNDWAKSDLKIKGAVRENPQAIESWTNKYPKDKTLVFYCA
jgi:hypothetical protein